MAGTAAASSIFATIEARSPELRVVVVGDALAPRTLLDAVAEGARAGAEVTVKRVTRAGLLA